MVGLKEMARSDAERAPPTWLRTMLETVFFEGCAEHSEGEGRNRRATACNFFCTKCAGPALCSGCLGSHEGHQLIQIRKQSGGTVVKVEDVQNLLNVSLVRTYVYNTERVVFLKKRPMSGLGKQGGTSRCEECDRALQEEGFRFCSLECKAEAIEDRLDFSISFAVYPNNNISVDEIEAEADKDEADGDDEDSSSSPSEFQI